jgi:hypothetical protein
MRLIKLLGPLVIVAMALLGTGTASATRLCKTAAGSGTCASIYPSGTKFAASSSELVLKSNLGTVICEKAAISGKTTGAGGGAGVPVTALVETMTMADCKLNSTKCTMAAENLNYTASFAWTSGNNGTFPIGKGTGGSFGVHVGCGALLDCSLSAAGATLDVDGGSPALLLAKEETYDTAAGFLCPSSAVWTATYVFSAPNPLFISSS